MLKRLAKDSAIYGLSTLLMRGIQIVLIPIYTRVLVPAEYGIVEVITIAAALVNLTVALEISQGVARYLAEARNQAESRAYAATALLFCMAAYGSFWILTTAFAHPLGQLLFSSEGWTTVLRIGLAAIAVNGVFALLQDMLRWQLKPLPYAAAAMCYTACSAGVGLYLVVGAKAGVNGILWGQLAGAVCGAAVSATALGSALIARPDFVKLRRMLAYSAPLVISSVAVFASTFCDRLVVKTLLGIEPLATYGVAARYASVVGLVTIGLQAALTPLVYRHYREPGTGAFLGRVFRLYCAAMIPLLMFIGVFSGELLSALAGPAFQSGKALLPLLAVSAFFFSLYIFAPGVYLAKRTGVAALLSAGAATLNFLIGIVLVPTIGIIGAAVASVVSSVAAFGGFLFLGQRHFFVPYHWNRVLPAFAILALVTGIAQGLANPAGIETAVRLGLFLAGCGMAIASCLHPEDRSYLKSVFDKRNKLSL